MKAVVIVANGWHAGWLGCYGNEWAATPHVDRFAAQSVVFDQHFAVNPTPDDWRRSLSSGCFELNSNAEARPSLIGAWRRSGLRTIRLHDCRGGAAIDTGDWDISIALSRQDDEPPGGALLGELAKQLKKLAAQDNWLLWIETDRLLPPWSVSLDYFDQYVQGIAPDDDGNAAQPWDDPPLGRRSLNSGEFERLYGTFASVVTEWDADLGRCFDLFRRFGLADSALLLLTSGHGLSLGEHDWIGLTGERLYEEAAHVPLVIHLPAAEQAGRRVSVQSASVDLLPTVCEAFQASLPDQLHGRSLLALARGSRTPLRSYSCQSMGTARALRTPEWALLVNADSTPRLFRKPEDRWEMNDLRMPHLEWAEHLEEALRGFIDAAGQSPFTPPPLKEYQDVIENLSSPG